MGMEHDNIVSELRKISSQLGALTEGQARQGKELVEIKIQVRATNGRVTALEAQRIAQEAVKVERRRLSEKFDERDDDVKEGRQKNIDRMVTIIVGLFGILAGILLTNGGVF